ncbi:MAG: TfoX/Sxy family protein [Alphaproteobacteria bacterium]|nr:TfoX/Sxy family protein [Alphaproteobacteria bacterium]
MSREFCEYLIDQLSSWANVTVRSMFGGFGVYRSGQIFGIVIDDTLYLKTDDTNRPDYEAASSEPFTYEAKGKRHSLSYWIVPSDVMDDQEALADWAEKAYQAGLRAPKSKPKKKPRR